MLPCWELITCHQHTYPTSTLTLGDTLPNPSLPQGLPLQPLKDLPPPQPPPPPSLRTATVPTRLVPTPGSIPHIPSPTDHSHPRPTNEATPSHPHYASLIEDRHYIKKTSMNFTPGWPQSTSLDNGHLYNCIFISLENYRNLTLRLSPARQYQLISTLTSCRIHKMP